jgi:hypothetical protein
MNVFIDIETIPEQPEEKAKVLIAESVKHPAQMKKQDTIDAWHKGLEPYKGVKDALIDDEYRKTSFDGAKGRICSIAWAVEDAAPTRCTEKVENEAALLSQFFYNLGESLDGRPPFFVGHYISGFDLRYIYHRSVILGVKPPFSLNHNGRHGQNFYDTMTAWCGWKGSISLDNLCKALGLPGKSDDIDGSKVWDFYKAGKLEEIGLYNIDDVVKVRDVFNRLNFS